VTPFLQLNLFEGPLDLLLHLCRRHELSVVDLPIAQVTEQFLVYLDVMEELEIQVAGEFVEMAALLCLIKSRELLPSNDIASELLDDGPDPREVLIERLLAYKQYRQAADELSVRPQPNRDYFLRGQSARATAGLQDADPPLDVDLVDLLSALRDLLDRRRATDPPHEVSSGPRIRIEDRMQALLVRLARDGEVPLEACFEGDATRPSVVATFLALLELARLRVLAVVQAGHLTAITLMKQFEGAPPALGVLRGGA